MNPDTINHILPHLIAWTAAAAMLFALLLWLLAAPTAAAHSRPTAQPGKAGRWTRLFRYDNAPWAGRRIAGIPTPRLLILNRVSGGTARHLRRQVGAAGDIGEESPPPDFEIITEFRAEIFAKRPGDSVARWNDLWAEPDSGIKRAIGPLSAFERQNLREEAEYSAMSAAEAWDANTQTPWRVIHRAEKCITRGGKFSPYGSPTLASRRAAAQVGAVGDLTCAECHRPFTRGRVQCSTCPAIVCDGCARSGETQHCGKCHRGAVRTNSNAELETLIIPVSETTNIQMDALTELRRRADLGHPQGNEKRSAQWKAGYNAALMEIDYSGEHCCTCADCGKSCRIEAWEIGKDDAGDCCPHCGGKKTDDTRNDAAWSAYVAPDDTERESNRQKQRGAVGDIAAIAADEAKYPDESHEAECRRMDVSDLEAIVCEALTDNFEASNALGELRRRADLAEPRCAVPDFHPVGDAPPKQREELFRKIIGDWCEKPAEDGKPPPRELRNWKAVAVHHSSEIFALAKSFPGRAGIDAQRVGEKILRELHAYTWGWQDFPEEADPSGDFIQICDECDTPYIADSGGPGTCPNEECKNHDSGADLPPRQIRTQYKVQRSTFGMSVATDEAELGEVDGLTVCWMTAEEIRGFLLEQHNRGFVAFEEGLTGLTLEEMITQIISTAPERTIQLLPGERGYEDPAEDKPTDDICSHGGAKIPPDDEAYVCPKCDRTVCDSHSFTWEGAPDGGGGHVCGPCAILLGIIPHDYKFQPKCGNLPNPFNGESE